jgi:hypothetical protein
MGNCFRRNSYEQCSDFITTELYEISVVDEYEFPRCMQYIQIYSIYIPELNTIINRDNQFTSIRYHIIVDKDGISKFDINSTPNVKNYKPNKLLGTEIITDKQKIKQINMALKSYPKKKDPESIAQLESLF